MPSEPRKNQNSPDKSGIYGPSARHNFVMWGQGNHGGHLKKPIRHVSIPEELRISGKTDGLPRSRFVDQQASELCRVETPEKGQFPELYEESLHLLGIIEYSA